jgi:hypothetical protein
MYWKAPCPLNPSVERVFAVDWQETGVVGFAETVGGQSVAAGFARAAESSMSLSSRADFSSGVDDFSR